MELDHIIKYISQSNYYNTSTSCIILVANLSFFMFSIYNIFKYYNYEFNNLFDSSSFYVMTFSISCLGISSSLYQIIHNEITRILDIGSITIFCLIYISFFSKKILKFDSKTIIIENIIFFTISSMLEIIEISSIKSNLFEIKYMPALLLMIFYAHIVNDKMKSKMLFIASLFFFLALISRSLPFFFSSYEADDVRHIGLFLWISFCSICTQFLIRAYMDEARL